MYSEGNNTANEIEGETKRKNLMNGRLRREAEQKVFFLLVEIGKAHRIPLREITGKIRNKAVVAARREFCIEGRRQQLQVEVLASILNIHPSCVTYHANAAYRENKNEMMRQRKERKSRERQNEVSTEARQSC